MTDPHPAHAESTTAPVSSTAALAALAGSFLARPLGPFHQRPLTPGPDDAANHDDDDDDEPLFYSSHPSRPPVASASIRQPAAHHHHQPRSHAGRPDALSAADRSTDSLPRTFPSTDSLLHDPRGLFADPEEGDYDDSRDRAEDERGASVIFDLGPADGDGDGDEEQPPNAVYLGRADQRAGERLKLVRSSSLERTPQPEARPFALPAAAAAAAPRVSSAAGGRGWLAHQSAYPTASTSTGPGTAASHSAGGRRARSDSTSSYSSSISSSTASSFDSNTSASHSLSESSDDAQLGARSSTRRSRYSPGVATRAPEPLADSRVIGRGDWRKYHDPGPLAAFLFAIVALVIFAPFTFSFTSASRSSDSAANGNPTPFRTLLHALPLLSLLLATAALAPPLLLWALRRSVRYALLGVAGLGVLVLGAVGWLAIVGSFEGEGWWGTIGLRLLALPPLIGAGIFSRNLYLRRSGAERTVKVVELACDVLLGHPPLLLLSPILLLAFGVGSSIFLLVWCRLFLIGWWESPDQSSYHYHLKAQAVWLLIAVAALWVWTWNVVRGVRRVVIAGVVGEWYFHRDDPSTRPADPDPFGLGLDVSDVRVAWDRATGRSLGSVCLGAGVSGCLLGLKYGAEAARRATSPTALATLPQWLSPLGAVHPLALIVVGALEQMNSYVLIYVGISGRTYKESTLAVGGLVRRRGREAGRKILDYTLLKTLLTLISLALSAAAALAAYFFTIHVLGIEGHAPIVGLLCGASVWTTVRFGVDALGDAADALFICFAIDEDNGGDRCAEARAAFGGPKRGPRTEV